MIKTLGLTLAAAGLMTITAQAVPITGDIFIASFGSYASVDQTANTVTFVDTSAAPGNALVGGGTGDFASLMPGPTYVTYVNFTYNPLSVVNPIWSTVTVGLASFDLTSITSISESASGLVLTGTGIISLAGFDNTAGTWSFGANTTDGTTFNFSSTTMAGVPDGGTTVVLLGAALSGLAWVNARRK